MNLRIGQSIRFICGCYVMNGVFGDSHASLACSKLYGESTGYLSWNYCLPKSLIPKTLSHKNVTMILGTT